MKLVEFIKLLLKHKVLLLSVPIALAALVIALTMNPKYNYYSQTMLYTGLASGSSVEMDKSFNYFATNIAFDNLINIINSRETQEEVAIRLLSQHLMISSPDPRIISEASYTKLMETVPDEVIDFIVSSRSVDTVVGHEPFTTLDENQLSSLFPQNLNRSEYEQTVTHLMEYMRSSNDNYVYKLLNFEDDHYSIKAISQIKAVRMSNSDLVKLSYEVNDPGICQQTLAIFSEVCQRRYKNVKENSSDAVVKYFEQQLSDAEKKLKSAENTLLEFNKSYNIINYYEQSKAVAIVKEEMEVDYNKKKAELAGALAATKKLEEKLDIQELVQAKSDVVLEKKKRLGDLNFEIAMTESQSPLGEAQEERLKSLKNQSVLLQKEIKVGVNELYTYQNSVEGVPLKKTLPDWMDNVVESEDLKARLNVMDDRNKEFQKQYAIYAPAGANLKRIEREIAVSEQGYLEILHGLNLAKLKSQDNELSANLKTLDPPYYPLSPIPTKRKLMVIGSFITGFVLVLAMILIMEFFDGTLRTLNNATKKIQLPSLGVLSKILLKPGQIDQDLVQKRLMQIIVQNLNRVSRQGDGQSGPKTILLLSNHNLEGKTVISKNVSGYLENQGKKVLLLNYEHPTSSVATPARVSRTTKLFGYTDPRIDVNHPFLQLDAESWTGSYPYQYQNNDAFNSVTSYKDILERNNIEFDMEPDYVIIELKPLLYSSYPMDLIANADLCILVCRSNRSWTEADKAIVDNLKSLSPGRIHFILNGLAMDDVEPILGDLPKKRSFVRRKIKDFLKLQFYAKNTI
jgi:polysaccharide biosynthesis transport protein